MRRARSAGPPGIRSASADRSAVAVTFLLLLVLGTPQVAAASALATTLGAVVLADGDEWRAPAAAAAEHSEPPPGPRRDGAVRRFVGTGSWLRSVDSFAWPLPRAPDPRA